MMLTWGEIAHNKANTGDDDAVEALGHDQVETGNRGQGKLQYTLARWFQPGSTPTVAIQSVLIPHEGRTRPGNKPASASSPELPIIRVESETESWSRAST